MLRYAERYLVQKRSLSTFLLWKACDVLCILLNVER